MTNQQVIVIGGMGTGIVSGYPLAPSVTAETEASPSSQQYGVFAYPEDK